MVRLNKIPSLADVPDMKPVLAGVVVVVGCGGVGGDVGSTGDGARIDARIVDAPMNDARADAAPGNGDAGTPSSGGITDPGTFSSGTRINARVVSTTTTTADGARYTSTWFSGWFDSQRNEVCAPALASDGVTRCLPAASAISTNVYGDSSCTILVALAATCGDAPAYVSVLPPAPPAGTCPGTSAGPKLFAAGTAYTSYYAKSGATCSGPSILATYTWYAAAGPEIDPTLFAVMTTNTTTTAR